MTAIDDLRAALDADLGDLSDGYAIVGLARSALDEIDGLPELPERREWDTITAETPSLGDAEAEVVALCSMALGWLDLDAAARVAAYLATRFVVDETTP